MMCPHGHARLEIAERHGVEIDYCPECRGVWLDRGELDKVIERAATAPAPSRLSDRGEEYRDDARYPSPRKKRESFLKDLFDF